MYHRRATKATFVSVSSSDSQFVLHQTGVAKLATSAEHVFTNCVVPNVAGKALKAVKAAITHGACTVGKIRYASSATVKKGSVISQQPRAGKKLAYQAVSLVVGKG